MVAPIFVILGIFGAVAAVPESIDTDSLSALNADSFAILGGSELVHLRGDLAYPEVRAEYIYGGLSWDSIRPRFAVSESSHGDFWAGAGIDYEKYWSINKDQAVFVGVNFLPGYYHPGAMQLGSAIEFRSQLEVGLVRKDRWRVSAYIEHRSNAGIGRINPGINAVGATFGLDL
jgi:hypothetical protein